MDSAKEKKRYIDYSFSWKGLRAEFVVKYIDCEIIMLFFTKIHLCLIRLETQKTGSHDKACMILAC